MRGWELAVLAGMLAATFAVIQHAGAGLTFFSDEWNVVVNRREWTTGAFLEPHGEHLILTTLLVFRVLLETVGMDAYWVFRAVESLLVAVCAALLWLYARPRLGPLLAWVPAGLLTVVGAAHHVLLWPFEMQFVLSLIGGLGYFLVIDRGGSRGSAVASAMIVLSLASGSIGLAVWVAAAVDIMLRPGARARLWVVVLPIAIYGAWWLGYHNNSFVDENLRSTPAYVVESLGLALRATFALPEAGTLPAMILWAAVCGWGFARAPDREHRVRLLALLALGFAYWALAGVARADRHEPGASRYLFNGAFFVLLPLVESARWVRVPRPLAVASVAATAALVLAVQMPRLYSGADGMRDYTEQIAPQLAAVELAGPRLPPSMAIDDVRTSFLFDVGPYLEAVRAYGSPVDGPAELRRGDPVGRLEADRLLVRGEMLRVIRETSRDCTRPVRAAFRMSPGDQVHVRAPRSGRILVSRFGPRLVEVPRPAGRAAWAIGAQPDQARRPWRVELSSGFKNCRR